MALTLVYSHVVELQQYTTFEDVGVLAHRVEQQKKSKVVKRESPKPFPRSQNFNKGSPQITPKPTGASSQIAPKTLTPQNKPPPNIATLRRCFKCHGLGYISSKCPNRRVITLAKYQASQEEEMDNEREVCFMKEQEGQEVLAKSNEREMLVIRTLNVQRSTNMSKGRIYSTTDDILINSKSEEDHLNHLKQVIQVLEKKSSMGTLRSAPFPLMRALS